MWRPDPSLLLLLPLLLLGRASPGQGSPEASATHSAASSAPQLAEELLGRFRGMPLTRVSERAQVDTLMLLHVMYRHGDRTPISTYPTDPYKNASYWPQGWGQLTNRGKVMEYRLGKFLRDRYNGFIDRKYIYNQIYVRSTDVDRTLMSAATNLAGLFPPEGDEWWDSSIDWQPIPIHTIPKDIDPMSTDSKCPRYDLELQKVYNSSEMHQLLAHYADLFAYLTNHTGTKIDLPKKVGYLYDTLFIEQIYNLTLPTWTASVYPTAMHPLFLLYFAMIGFTPEMRRLRGGPILGEITRHMRDHAEGHLTPSGRRVFVYSAHDSTLTALQLALGVYNNVPPPYASAFMIELHQGADGKSPVVRMFYRNDTKGLWGVKLRDCPMDCPLDVFHVLTEGTIPTDWKAECQEIGGYNEGGGFIDNLPGITIGATVLAGILGLILMASILIGLAFWQRSMKPAYHYFTVQAE